MGRPKKHIVSDGYLRKNVKELVLRSKQGFPNIIIVFGATRSGKTTIAAQCAKEMATQLGVKFDVDNIFFDSELCLKEAKKGHRNAIYHIDEAAFDLMGEDWKNKSDTQINFLKLIMTAAMYAQTYFLCIPKLEKLREPIVTDDHVKGLETYYNHNNYEKGFFRGYDRHHLLYRYTMLRSKRYKEAAQTIPNFKGRFSANLDFLDLERYLYMKKEAIDRIGENSKDASTRWRTRWEECALQLKKDGYQVNAIAKLSKMQPQSVTNYLSRR